MSGGVNEMVQMADEIFCHKMKPVIGGGRLMIADYVWKRSLNYKTVAFTTDGTDPEIKDVLDSSGFWVDIWGW